VAIKLASVIVITILHKHVTIFIITSSAVLANTYDSISQNVLLKATTSNAVHISFLYNHGSLSLTIIQDCKYIKEENEVRFQVA
jgi:hypothetical protein